MENNALVDISKLSPEMQEYLKSLDQDVAKKNSGPLIPELRIVSSDKMADDTLIPKGEFMTSAKGEGDTRNITPRGKDITLVILGVNNQYTLFDEAEQKVLFQTSEFQNFNSDKLVCKDNITGMNIFEGTAKEFKQFALNNFAKGGDPTKHKFSYRWVFYVLLPDDIATNGPVGSVYRLYVSTSGMENVNAWEKSLKGTPVRYLTKLSSEHKDVGSNRVYFPKFELVGIHETTELISYLEIKQQLDQALRNTFNEYMKDGAGIKHSNKEEVVSGEIESPVQDIPFSYSPKEDRLAEARTIANPPTGSGVSTAEADAIFGM